MILKACFIPRSTPGTQPAPVILSAPILNDIIISDYTSAAITISKPTFSTVGVPTPTLLAYIGLTGTISIDGTVVSDSIEGPIDVSSAGYAFDELNDDTSYDVIVVASNSEGYSVKSRTQATQPTGVPSEGYVNFISQNNILLTFDDEYEYGQYITGDYYNAVGAGSLSIIEIDPPSVAVDGYMSTSGWSLEYVSGWTYLNRTMNGAMLNPGPNMNRNGYDSEMFAWVQGYGRLYPGDRNYNAAYNYALDVSESTPLEISAGNSLVCAKSVLAGQRPQLSDAMVLTVVSSAPAANSFRPPYTGTDKTSYFTLSDINYDILPGLSLSGITGALYFNAAAIVSMLNKVHLNWYGDAGGRTQYASPTNNMPGYGRDYETLISEATCLLLADKTTMESTYGITQQSLAVGMCQLGIDLYGMVKTNQLWRASGGLNIGRKWPILFAGLLLEDDDMQDISSYPFVPVPTSGADATSPFAEQQNRFYVSASDVSSGRYTSDQLAMPEWGQDHTSRPSYDDSSWSVNYRRECGQGAVGYMLAVLALTGAQALWAQPASVDYQDRYMTLMSKGSTDRSWSRFCENMWDAYRGNYAGSNDVVGEGYDSVSEGVRAYDDCATVGITK